MLQTILAGALATSLLMAGAAGGQERPAIDPANPSPPRPAPAPPPAPKPALIDAPQFEAFLHGFCPDGLDRCGYGAWVGIRARVLHVRDGAIVGMAADARGGGAFGLGVENLDDRMSGRKGIVYVTGDVSFALGPGVRLGPFDLLTGLGVGAEGIAFHATELGGSSSELYWYGTGALRARFSAAVALEVGAARMYPDFDRVGAAYQTRLDARLLVRSDRTPISFGVYWLDYAGLRIAGVSFGADLDSVSRKHRR